MWGSHPTEQLITQSRRTAWTWHFGPMSMCNVKLFGAVRLWILNFACDCEMRSIAWTVGFAPDSDGEGWLAVLSRMKHLAARYLALTVWIILVPIALVSFSPKRLRGQMRVIWRNSLALEIKEKCQIVPVFVVAEVWTDRRARQGDMRDVPCDSSRLVNQRAWNTSSGEENTRLDAQGKYLVGRLLWITSSFD